MVPDGGPRQRPIFPAAIAQAVAWPPRTRPAWSGIIKRKLKKIHHRAQLIDGFEAGAGLKADPW